MTQQPSGNHYDILQVSQNASYEVIEKMFRFLATKHHPDAGGEKDSFNQIVRSFEVLRNPNLRREYDAKLKNETNEISLLVENSKQTGADAVIRHQLLTLFYARRRQNASEPALGAVAIEKTLGIAESVLDFHLWYFREKGWIARWESGGFAITAEGVDQIDANELMLSQSPRIAATPNSAPVHGELVQV